MIIMPICINCVHQDTTSSQPIKCAAYPLGIPPEIFKSYVDHREPYTGDHGIQYAPIEKDFPIPRALANPRGKAAYDRRLESD